MDDSKLVELARRGDARAYGTLVERHQTRTYATLRKLTGDHDLAMDIAQDAFLSMLRKLPDYDVRLSHPFRVLLFRIARNRLIDLHRRRKRRGEVDLSETLSTALANPQVLAERALERGQLQVALKHLTEEQRQVIVLKFIQGFDNRSVGRILGRSEGAVKSLQHRALGALRRILYPDGRRT